MKLMPLSRAAWMVATLSASSLPFEPQTGDMRIQPNPSFDTNGPPLPRAIFAIVAIVSFFLTTQRSDLGLWGELPLRLNLLVWMAQRMGEELFEMVGKAEAERNDG